MDAWEWMMLLSNSPSVDDFAVYHIIDSLSVGAA